jgi:hypothetical protein
MVIFLSCCAGAVAAKRSITDKIIIEPSLNIRASRFSTNAVETGFAVFSGTRGQQSYPTWNKALRECWTTTGFRSCFFISGEPCLKSIASESYNTSILRRVFWITLVLRMRRCCPSAIAFSIHLMMALPSDKKPATTGSPRETTIWNLA